MNSFFDNFNFDNFDVLGNAGNIGFDMGAGNIAGGAYNTDLSGLFGQGGGDTSGGWMSSLMGSGGDKGWLEQLGPLALGAYGMYGQDKMNDFNMDITKQKMALMNKDDKRYNEYLDSWAGAFGGGQTPAPTASPTGTVNNTGIASAFSQPTLA